ncbi:MAG: transporter substrate-binding domain-containing protein [Clostridia bacterium]|nr:transporter substrate-binding domain-containing protein [Clostridia bacterium]
MKKVLSFALVSLMLVLALTGCATTVKTNNEEASLAIACELTSEEYGIGFRKGSDLTAVVNDYIAELEADGTLAALAEKYDLALSDLAPAEEEEVTLADVDYVKANGKLIIGITDYEPMNYKDAEDKWTGFDTEFAEAVCEKLGVAAEFVEIDWDNKFVALESKAIDCIWNGMTISEDVLKNTSCSAAYVKNAQVVVMAADKAADYADAESMKDLSFAAESGSAGAAAAEECGFANLTEVGTQTDALLEVTSGSCDACIIDLTMANAMVK